MKRILIRILVMIIALPCYAVYGDNHVTSQQYVDNAVATYQDTIPASNPSNTNFGETVMTYTSADGAIGERALYTGGTYDPSTDGNKLITASALKGAFTTLPETDTTKLECANTGCTLWNITTQTAYGDVLPPGYLQRQYIYMLDGSYLLTDIVPSSDMRIEMDFQTTSMPATSVALLGGRTETYGGLYLVKGGRGTLIVDAFGTNADSRYTSSVSPANNTRYKFTYDNQVVTLTSGGTTLFTNTMTGTSANGTTLVLNGLNNNGDISGGAAGIYVYSFKAWDNQGNLVANYVPAVQKGTVPVVGFYDTVSKTFKTATAGTFAAGLD